MKMAAKSEDYLRDRLLRIVLDAISTREVTREEALAACMGAAATVLGTYSVHDREAVAAALDGVLLKHANVRARELRSGDVDTDMARSNQ
jgi:hypothetical protein